MASARCPDCGDMVNLGSRPREDQALMCPHCDADLQLVSLDPPTLDWAYGDSDTWEDEDDEEEEG